MTKQVAPRKYPTNNNLLQHVRWLTDFAYSNQAATQSVKGALTKETADQLYGPKALRPHLLAGGAHALTISGMLGQAAEPQLANIPITVGVLANIPTDFGTHEAGEIFVATDVGHFFVWTGSVWSMLDGAGYAAIAQTSPLPTAFWKVISASGGTIVNVTKTDGSGTTAITFGSYTAPGSGYNLYVRI